MHMSAFDAKIPALKGMLLWIVVFASWRGNEREKGKHRAGLCYLFRLGQ